MVDERIYIDGTLFELPSDGGEVGLVYQSPLFTDIDAIVSNRTNSVNFPLTITNRKAIQMAGVSGTDYPYREHTAHYYRDGSLLFSGKAILLSLTDKAVTFSFVWGNNEVFEGLLNTKLSELQEDSDLSDRYLRWGYYNQDTTYYPEGVEFGINEAQYKHPVIPVGTIMEAIEAHTGVTGLSGVFNDYAIPLLTKKTDRTANIAQSTHIVKGSVLRNGTQPIYGCLGLASGYDIDLPQIYLGDGIFDVANRNTLTLINKSVLVWSVEFDNERYNISNQAVIEAVDEDGNNGVVLATIEGTTYTDSGTTRTFIMPVTEVSVDVAQYSYVRIRLFEVTSSEEIVSIVSTTITSNPNLRVVLDIDQEQTVLYNNTSDYIIQYPVYLNLPDWSVGQLLKNLAKLSGKFAYCKSAGVVDFVTLDEVYTKRAFALDLSGRILGEVQERKFTFGNMAQRNLLKYSEDDTVTGNYDGAIVVRNFALESEAELLSVDFAGTDMVAGVAQIKLYQYEIDGEGNRSVEYNDGLTPRVLLYSNSDHTMVTFAGLSWGELVLSKYATYQRTVERPLSLVVRAYIEPRELALLDLSVPCFVSEFGHYFAIITLTTENNNIAKVEMLRLA